MGKIAVSFIQNYDIVHFSETKWDCFDDVIVDGYAFMG